MIKSLAATSTAAVLLAALITPALAQESTPVSDATTDSVTEESSVTEPAVDISFAGLDDTDLEVDLEAEALPTTNGFAYRWERIRDNLVSVFTFNAEKKAARYQQRLHRLDRKLAACSEIGDAKCVDQITKHIQQLSDRTARYIANKEAIRAKHLERFNTWRDNRESLIQARREKAQQLSNRRQELRQQRQANRKAARQRRQEHRQTVKDNIQQHREQRQQNIQDRRDQRQLNIEQRQENREQLIEMRSEVLKDKLDTTRTKVQTRQENLTNTEES